MIASAIRSTAAIKYTKITFFVVVALLLILLISWRLLLFSHQRFFTHNSHYKFDTLNDSHCDSFGHSYLNLLCSFLDFQFFSVSQAINFKFIEENFFDFFAVLLWCSVNCVRVYVRHFVDSDNHNCFDLCISFLFVVYVPTETSPSTSISTRTSRILCFLFCWPSVFIQYQ